MILRSIVSISCLGLQTYFEPVIPIDMSSDFLVLVHQ
jgi:hypothetical protein